jgi:hypothetical protein
LSRETPEDRWPETTRQKLHPLRPIRTADRAWIADRQACRFLPTKQRPHPAAEGLQVVVAYLA